jgi:chorismate mutase
MDNELKKYRKKIDYVDSNIVDLLSKRMELVKKISLVKQEKNMSILQELRWKDVLDNVKKQGTKKNLSNNFIDEIWSRIHEESLRQQKK